MYTGLEQGGVNSAGYTEQQCVEKSDIFLLAETERLGLCPKRIDQCTVQWLGERGNCLSYVLKNAPYLVSNGPLSTSHKNDSDKWFIGFSSGQ